MSGKRWALGVPLLAIGLAVSACGSSSKGTNAAATTSPSGQPSASSSPGSAQTVSLPKPPTSSVSISETGSTLLYPLFQKWAPDYHTAYSNITITPQGTGSGTGISQAEKGTADIGASDAYLSPGDVQKYPSMLNIPLAISAQQINYNVPGVSSSTHLKLDGQVLAEMYMGKITKWNDPAIAALNPGVTLPSTTVVPLHRSDGSGDTFLFTQYLSKQAASTWGSIGYGTTVSWPSVAGELGEQGNGGMVSGCQNTKGCIAYIGISFLDQAQKAGLGYADLKNGAGNFVTPTSSTIQAEAAGFTSKTPANETISLINGNIAQGYPIINYEYAIINPKQLHGATAQAVEAFLGWAVSSTGGNQSQYLNAVHFQPLPTNVQQLSIAQISKIGG